MQRNKTRWMVSIIAWLLPALGWAAEPADPTAEDLVALGQRVEKKVIELRGLPSKKPIRWEVATKAKITEYLVKTLGEQYQPGEMEKEGLALTALGLIPRTLNYKDFVLALYQEQVGGYYDPKKETFYLADWISAGMQEPIIAHELTHALEDQNFNIDAFIDRIRGNSDAMYSRAALVEGEATLVMMLYMMGTMAAKLDAKALESALDMDGPMGQMMMSLSASQFPKFSEAPRALRESLMFPYLRGLSFVLQGKKRGGWNRVDQVYADLPGSTEQILHPEKYFEVRDPPVLVSLDFLNAVKLTGWENIYDDVLGEFMTLQFLDPLKNREEEKKAAAGWGGDRFRVFRKGEQLALVQLSAWDTEQDAVEYNQALSKMVASRFPQMKAQATGTGSAQQWKDKDGQTVFIDRRGNRVLTAENFDAPSAEQILRQAWKEQPKTPAKK